MSLSRTHLGAALAVVLSVLALGLTFASTADADIFWSTLGAGDNGTTIGRANHDGSGVNPSFITGASGPCGIGINSSHIYWANSNNNSIGRANLDGSGANNAFLDFPSGGYCDIGLSESHVFWSASGNIGRADLNGGSPSTSLVSAPNQCGLAVFGGLVYWGSFDVQGIGRANTDGSGVMPGFMPLPSTFPCVGVVTATHIFWDYGTTVARANIDGSGVTPSFIASDANGCNMATDGVYLYWTTETSIGRANLDGSSPNTNFIAGLDRPCGVAATQLSVPPPQVEPQPKVVVKSKKARRNGNINLVVDVSGAGKVLAAQEVARKKRGKKKKKAATLVKKASKSATAAGNVTLVMKPTTAAKKLFKKGKRVRVKVLVTYTDAKGAKATAKTTLVFKPKKRKR